ncbi:MAG: gliding motility-associated transport system permease protein [Verrucomicrobiota bacterium]
MQTWWTLMRRELGGYFLSMSGYIIIAAAMFMMGFSFVALLWKIQAEPTTMPVTEMLTPFFWAIFVLATPIITMRLFAQEKFAGTFETLMTTPVSEFEVVLAKFTAALAFYSVLWLPFVGCLFVVRHYTNDPAPFDSGVFGTTFLGILLVGCLYLSMGCFASAITRSQVTAAMISLVAGACLFLLGLLADKIPAPANWQAQALSSLALFEQMRDFARGVVDTRSVVLFVTLTLFFLFLTLRIVESRRWK